MTKDMTTGPITPLLVNFTIPLVLGNLFQLTYNAVTASSWANLSARMPWLRWAPPTR